MLTREQFNEMLSKRNNNSAKANNQPKVGEQLKMPGVPDYSNVGKNRPTQKMVDKIKEFAERKQVELDTSRLQTFEDARDYMQELYDMPLPARKRPVTEKQKAKIIELCNETQTELPNFDELDGSYGGSASQLIKDLIAKSQDEKSNVHIPLTANQSAEIHRYQLCPDVTAHNADGKPFSDEDIEQMSTAEAYQYIELHDMMGCPRMGYEALIQFDTNQASLYITQLEAEYNRKDWNATSLEKEDDYLNDEVRHRHDTSEEKALADMRNMAAKLYAAMGQQLEDIDEWLIDDYKELVHFTAETAGEEVARNIVEDNESLSPELKDWFFEEDDAPSEVSEDEIAF